MNAYENFKTLNDRCKYIFNIIQKDGPVTKNELLNRTRMALTTLNRGIKILINRKIVVETATAESTGGRKPVLYDVNPSDYYGIGMDISRTYAEIVITNLKFKKIAEIRMDDSYNVDRAIESLPKSINDLLEKSQMDKSMIIGFGIGIVIGFDMEVLYNQLVEEYEVPVCIDNGANAAVIGERFSTSGKDKQNIAFINCGVGIRTGVIFAGVLIRTINNSEDAFGHMIVDAHGELCSCGNHGCVETYASISRIAQKYICEIEKAGKKVLEKNLNEINYIDVCNLAKSNNKIAKDILIDSAVHFGIGLANFIRLLNPQLIILSGPLVQHSPLFYEVCKKITLEKCHIINNKIVFSKGGYFKNNSISVGASVMAIQEITRYKD